MKLYGKNILLNLGVWALIVLAIFFILAWVWGKIGDGLAAFKKAWLGGVGTGPITDAIASTSHAVDSAARAVGVNVDALPTLDRATAQRIQYDEQRSLFAELNDLSVSNDNEMTAAGWPDIFTWKTNTVVIQGYTWGPSSDTTGYLERAANE